ncbi:hypothetical protein [Phenylobacterium sp.]|uniref:hypothetical protein n=1 Tax=Phenylobacterium sp. TaxID=1871053 RepID=UPI003D2CAD83
MTEDQRLTLVRAVHTAIYVVMAGSAFVLLYAGVTGAHGVWLWVAGGLMSVECVVFIASGMRCPLTAVAQANGAERRGVSDTFFPERLTRHTLRVFAPIIAVAALLLAARALGLGWA